MGFLILKFKQINECDLVCYDFELRPPHTRILTSEVVERFDQALIDDFKFFVPGVTEQRKGTGNVYILKKI